MNSDFLAHFLEIVPIGLASGMLSGAFGVGGGIITVPLIRLIVGVTAHVAVGNSLAVILPTAIIAAINYLKGGKLLPLLAFSCGAPAVLGSIIASELAHFVSGQVLMLVLAGLMMVVGLDFASGFGSKLKAAAKEEDEAPFELNQRNLLTASLIGLLAGLLSGMLGVGGGFIMVPAFCYFLGVPLKLAFGTSLIVIAMVAVPGTAIHAMQGHVSLSIVVPMLVGSLPGAWIGSYFSLKAKDKSLRVVFGAILLVMACAFAYRELFGANALPS